MENRRNYYRILQVQPDAPQAVIETCYRTLMQKLKYHPDLGGDHWNAALVNEAYYVLSNPQRRRQYDESLGDKRFHFQRCPPENGRGAAPGTTASTDAPRAVDCICPFCGARNPAADRRDNPICGECHSPLQTVEIYRTDRRLRRALNRVDLQADVRYYTGWPQNPRFARLCDLSPVGLAMRVMESLVQNELIKIESAPVSAVGLIVRTRTNPGDGPHYVGVKLLTASFDCRRGTFLNVEI